MATRGGNFSESMQPEVQAHDILSTNTLLRVLDANQSFVTEHAMKRTECSGEGKRLGHLVPSSLILIAFLFYTWIIFSRYFKSIAPGSNYEFSGHFGRMSVPWNPRLPIGALVLIASIIHSLGSSPFYVDPRTGYDAGTVLGRMRVYYTANAHFPLYCTFALGAMFDVLEPRKRFHIPARTSSVFYGLAFFVTAVLNFLNHAFPRMCAFGAKIHMIFFFFPSLLTMFSMMGVLFRPSNIHFALSTAFWGCVTGMGGFAIGLLLFNDADGGNWLDSDPPEVKMGKLPTEFFVGYIYFMLFFIAAFFVFGFCRGSRLGTKNPEYYVHDDDEYLPIQEDGTTPEERKSGQEVGSYKGGYKLLPASSSLNDS